MNMMKTIGGGYAAPAVEIVEVSCQSVFAASYGAPGKTGSVYYDINEDDIDF